MIINPGHSDAASFNDDSSPDTRLTSGQKLAINAQVVPEGSLDWYFKILQLCESVPGELKSADVWPRFQALGTEDRQRIWAGLSKVRIHIVDPRPYGDSLHETLREVFHWKEPAKVLAERLELKNPHAIWLSKQLQVFTAERILSDSTGARVYSLSRFLGDSLMLFAAPPGSQTPDVIALDVFGPDVKPMIRKVSMWAAKSAATFHKALDCFMEFDETVRYSPNALIQQRMAERVLEPHVFDQGDHRQLELLEDARTNILDSLRSNATYLMALRQRKPYQEADSRNSYLVQAADIAAGIASKVLETQNLVAVVSSFEYVTYNGRRMSIAEAEEELRLMRWHHPEKG
jgi:hypothetical protein